MHPLSSESSRQRGLHAFTFLYLSGTKHRTRMVESFKSAVPPVDFQRKARREENMGAPRGRDDTCRGG